MAFVVDLISIRGQGGDLWRPLCHFSDHHSGGQCPNDGRVVAVAELPQIVDRLTSEVLSGERPPVELTINLGQGVSDQVTEVLGLGHVVCLN